MTTSYLSEYQLDKLSTVQLPDFFEKNGLQRIYTANNPAWRFNILNDTWQLGTKDILNLEFMNTLNLPINTWLSLRMIIADKAENYAFGTVKNLSAAIRAVGNGWQNNLHFQAAFNSLRNGNKRNLISYFRKLNKTHLIELLPLKEHFSSIINFLEKQKYPNEKRLKGIFDPEKGIYTDEEQHEIHEKLRLQVSSIMTQFKNDTVPDLFLFNKLRNLTGLLLMITIYRRPVQLSMMKWSDVLPVGISFKDHQHSIHSASPESETEFSDVAQVHLRTFKAKRGYGFREYAEHRSHRMEPEFSKLIGIYRHFYKILLMDRITTYGIQLNEDELEELVFRCPLLPSGELFTTPFNNKSTLFSSIGHQSDSMHPTPSTLRSFLESTSKHLSLSSTRVREFNISNNRSRHTVITNAIEKGLSTIQASAITGVTPSIINNYTHLDIKGRIAIDESMAGHKILDQFTHISINELKTMKGFIVINEFDEVQGRLKEDTSCHTCLTKVCKPIGCYGCDNFIPFWDADHDSNLARIEQKIAFNESESPNKNTLKRLKISQLYCKATISIINEKKFSERGVNQVD